ncbi:phage minor capsid protein [Streptomyces hesseae]|uniref:phage minor capsid protein n=1 Tax=Streptomyces hesseae TaxID=3075519 RepID=UPI003F68B44B
MPVHPGLVEDLSAGVRDRIAESTPNTRAVDRLTHETVDRVEQTHRGILRGIEDGYRQVVAEIAGTPLLGIDTRRQATQAAMARFADRGLKTFVDRAGRSWSMTSYAEMDVRTAVGRAAVAAHGDRLRAAGLDLVIVSNAPHECPLRKPFEGKVLSLEGADGARTVEAEHATKDGRTIEVQIAGSVDEARRTGLQHPNCRHSLSAYLPGVTRAPVEHSTDPDGYAASQRQRAIRTRHPAQDGGSLRPVPPLDTDPAKAAPFDAHPRVPVGPGPDRPALAYQRLPVEDRLQRPLHAPQKFVHRLLAEIGRARPRQRHSRTVATACPRGRRRLLHGLCAPARQHPHPRTILRPVHAERLAAHRDRGGPEVRGAAPHDPVDSHHRPTH